MNFRCKYWHHRSIRRPRFPGYSAKFRRFGDVYRWILHFICWMSAIFLLPVCLTYWPRKYTTRVESHVNNSHQVWSPYADPFLSYEWQRFPLLTIKNAYAASAHAPNHVTVSRVVKNNYIFGITDPDLPIHYTTFTGLRRRLRVVYSRASPMLKPLTV